MDCIASPTSEPGRDQHDVEFSIGWITKYIAAEFDQGQLRIATHLMSEILAREYQT